ncbi:LysR family transcriptional regulator [Actinoallomurus sp. CA-150999]|uniref:LysR family transcriptional regulator n=1 Tax=Actinoallomurus sp. CA-150999 TaxID=3239887 RepID=UPI003D8E1A60
MGLGAIDLNLLVALEALLEDRNVTHAGMRLSTSQSAMSGSLARLRRHFNDELLVRVGREYELTPLAERLLPIVQETLRNAEEALSLTKQFDPARSHQRFSIVMSDYAMSMFVEPLLQIIAREAPGVRIDFHPLIPGQPENETHLRCHDLMVVPLGYRLPGISETVMHDRFVCIVDPGNPYLRDGRLTLGDLAAMPHAVAGFGKSPTPADRQLETLGIVPKVQVSTPGFSVLPFLVAGTDLVALVPERLADRYAVFTRCVAVPTPFPDVPLVEAMYWHHNRHTDPGHRWLREIVGRVGTALDEPTAATPTEPTAATPTEATAATLIESEATTPAESAATTSAEAASPVDTSDDADGSHRENAFPTLIHAS